MKEPPTSGQQADGTHPTGMLSCFILFSNVKDYCRFILVGLTFRFSLFSLEEKTFSLSKVE